ncbi:hypothetical protein pETSU_259 [Edwardsiella phage pEt-SU]|uniref:Uncharacterized protein n=1 Tax=Edwardsiella phage pEt-SU TaxID=2562142 RepID=A0A4D6DWX6_9CAUD|nr:hypothetical protein HOV39_gp263 [Edwardsiella phage pEt-SU]QBZ70840.1 hypothetical protein pETSU_259 [Edwardsiella phage pEt-SU]
MTFVEQYSLVMRRFFKENKDNVERLKEMLCYIRHPDPNSILGDMESAAIKVGDATFRVTKIQGEWCIQIKDASYKNIGSLEYKDEFLIYCDDISKRTVAIEVINETVQELNLFQILLDNY